MMFKENYFIVEKVCETSSSIVYKSINNITNKCVAIKVEKPQNEGLLLNETKMRKLLENVDGIPKIMEYGVYKNRRYIMYPFISKTLYHVELSREELYKCGVELVNTIRTVHMNGVVHRDISAMNVFCNQNKTLFYLSDFGQACHFNFALKNTGLSHKLTGCPLFCSENVHNGIEYSYRDDMVSIGYLMYFCLSKKLPWSGMKTHRDILEKKKEFRKKYWNIELIPNELKIYLNYSFHLKINDIPEYTLLSKLFESVIKHLEIQA